MGVVKKAGERGFVLLTFVVTVTVLLAFLGLVTDVGMMVVAKRQAQAAADAGAWAGAMELTGGGDVAAAAADDVTTNGFTQGVSGATVITSNPPDSGSLAGNANFVEVTVNKTLPTTFMRVLGIATMTVRARSVAGRGAGGGCIFVLNPSLQGALNASGSSQINASCGIVVNSNNSKAMVTSGSACITGSSISVTGNYSDSSSCGPSPAPQTNVAATPDPLAHIPAPAVPACTHTGSYNANGLTVSPGVYCGGIKVSGGSTAHFLPGAYYLVGGGLNVSGGSNIDGSGVFFYNTGNSTYAYKPIVISGGSVTWLSAPTTGTYAGILFFQDRSITDTAQNTVSGGGSAGFTGALYFPSTPLVYSGGSFGTAPYTIIVADRITFSGGSNINNDYSSLTGGSPVRSGAMALAE